MAFVVGSSVHLHRLTSATSAKCPRVVALRRRRCVLRASMLSDSAQKLQDEQGMYCDRDAGIVTMRGADRAKFVHNMSTNNISLLQPGQVRMTTLTTSTGRIVDLVTILIGEDDMFLITSGSKAGEVTALFDKYIFPADKVEVENVTDSYCVVRVINPEADILAPENRPERGEFKHIDLGSGHSALASRGSGLSFDGLTLTCKAESQQSLVLFLKDNGLDHELSAEDWEILRISDGRPAVGKELTVDYNPLEAGLWKTVSFKKGCYIGQETIARLNTYDGVKQNLFGVELNGTAKEGTVLRVKGSGDKAGVLTSCAQVSEDRSIGLAYIRRKVRTLLKSTEVAWLQTNCALV
mmetsp:Transcript_10591/g.32414  ORF Transcript_10591/g.32414 Transcript_10591/m.32414 type:complete len:352 (-) Transcript_10591:1351-2406(-)